MGYRIEKDIVGKVRVPEKAYFGSETQRAMENFKISGIHVDISFICSYAMLKKASALANIETGGLDKKKGKAIVQACEAIINGKLADQFGIDVFQAGAGTNVNMNLNEVIANKAIELLGGRRGEYGIVHPNDHVNMSQSTNDTYHSNMHVYAYSEIKASLLPELLSLRDVALRKSRMFSRIVKVGRTHLQDAVPITLGQEFSGYAMAVDKAAANVSAALNSIRPLPIGGTAVGTGINASEEYSRAFIVHLNRMSSHRFTISRNRFASMQNQLGEMIVSDSIKNAAVVIGKIANDMRLLASGPSAGIGEIALPEIQPGSSIMPGKVNPSMAEMMNMVCMQTIGANAVIRDAASSGQLELNVFMPLVSYNLVSQIKLMTNAVRSFRERCVSGIKANTANIERHLNYDISIATALNTRIGYEKAAEVARKAFREHKSVMQVCMELKILDERTLKRILDPKRYV
jgi:fumarate hydratase class II